jgi:hypothetical protein
VAQEYLRQMNFHLPANSGDPGAATDRIRAPLLTMLAARFAGRGRRPPRAEAERFLAGFEASNEAVRRRWFPQRAVLFDRDLDMYPTESEPDFTFADAVGVSAVLWRWAMEACVASEQSIGYQVAQQREQLAEQNGHLKAQGEVLAARGADIARLKAELAFQKGRIARIKGELDNAECQFRLALDCWPDHEEARGQLAKLDRLRAKRKRKRRWLPKLAPSWYRRTRS